MIHFTIFGGTEVQLSPSLRMCLTVFGATEIRRPTMARLILNAKRRSRNESRPTNRGPMRFSLRNRCVVLTLFGATEVTCPTLAEEFIDLKSLLASESITPQEWERAAAQLSEEETGVDFITLTLFGGFGLEFPSRADELKRLDKQADLGLITQREQEALVRLADYDPKDARAMLIQTVTT